MKRGTKTALWLVPLAIALGVIVAAVNERGLSDDRGTIVDSAALVEQLDELPTVAAADTATIVRTDLASRAIEVDTRQGPRRYRIDHETRIRTPTAPIGLGAFETGHRIAVSARRDGDAFVTTDIVVVAVGAEPPPDPGPKEKP